MKNLEIRKSLADSAMRMVVKAGSRVLVNRNGRPDSRRLEELVSDIVALHRQGREVVLVSSGAIAAGLEALGIRKRPEYLPDLQMAAAVGQSRLMTMYDRLFSARKCRVGQVLLTHDDLAHRQRHLNARNTMLKLLENRVIPVVNENDVISVDEIKFGDNDALASRVAMLLEADLLVLLTTVNGFNMADAKGKTRKVDFLPALPHDLAGHTHGKGSAFSTGGMLSKLQSAADAAHMGISVVIANGRKSRILQSVLSGANVCTLLPGNPKATTAEGVLNRRRRWVALFHKPTGEIVIDDGARDALLLRGKSLLPVGVREIAGDFPVGALVMVRGLDGAEIARGLSEYTSDELRLLKGLQTAQIRARLGEATPGEVIHRDNLVVYATSEGTSI